MRASYSKKNHSQATKELQTSRLHENVELQTSRPHENIDSSKELQTSRPHESDSSKATMRIPLLILLLITEQVLSVPPASSLHSVSRPFLYDAHCGATESASTSISLLMAVTKHLCCRRQRAAGVPSPTTRGTALVGTQPRLAVANGTLATVPPTAATAPLEQLRQSDPAAIGAASIQFLSTQETLLDEPSRQLAAAVGISEAERVAAESSCFSEAERDADDKNTPGDLSDREQHQHHVVEDQAVFRAPAEDLADRVPTTPRPRPRFFGGAGVFFGNIMGRFLDTLDSGIFAPISSDGFFAPLSSSHEQDEEDSPQEEEKINCSSVEEEDPNEQLVFGIGLPRTGSHSLAEALKMLGFRGLNVCLLTRSRSKHFLESELSISNRIFSRGRFEVDNSMFLRYQNTFFESGKEAKFILLTRASDSAWKQSVERWDEKNLVGSCSRPAFISAVTVSFIALPSCEISRCQTRVTIMFGITHSNKS